MLVALVPTLGAFLLAALVLVSVFTFGGSWLLYKLVDLITPLRVDEHHEQLGLDLSQHGVRDGDAGERAGGLGAEGGPGAGGGGDPAGEEVFSFLLGLGGEKERFGFFLSFSLHND